MAWTREEAKNECDGWLLPLSQGRDAEGVSRASAPDYLRLIAAGWYAQEFQESYNRGRWRRAAAYLEGAALFLEMDDANAPAAAQHLVREARNIFEVGC